MRKIYRKLIGYRSRYNYWSCSKFADYVREIFRLDKKPTAETFKGWRQWRNLNEKAHPIIHWIVEEGFNNIQDTIYFPYDVYRNIRDILHNIFISKSHVLPTNLPKGQWYDCDTRLLHGIFELLIDFVEHEKAHMHNISIDGPTVKDRRKAGLAHLDWEISLGDESPYQSKAAKEIKEIYLWIKDIRPNRTDPYDESGWSEYCENERDIIGIGEYKSDDERNKVRKLLDILHGMEAKQKDEDTEMLCRIIKIREGMWT